MTRPLGRRERIGQAGLKSRRARRICGQSQFKPEAEVQMANPLQFLQQVRTEVAKVVWPTRREVMLTTVMVFIMAALTSVFFFLVDVIIKTGLHAILGMAG